MTRHGKCDNCRTRKVKCDETWPICGPCSIKQRPCHYKSRALIHDQNSLSRTKGSKSSSVGNGAPPRNANGNMPTLRLKYQEKVQEGQGEFLTFESIRQPSPSTAITCPWTRTVASLGSIFGYEALDLEAAPLGPWMRLEWPSSDTCLELASQYVLEGVVVFQHSHSPPSVQNVNKIGSSALRSLQISVGSCGQDKDKEILLMAVMLHFAAEIFAGVATWRFVPHVQGICQLLKSFKVQPSRTVLQSVVTLICHYEVLTAIHYDRPSDLEAIARSHYVLTEPPQINIAGTVLDDLLIRIPRLVCLVRACAQDNNDLKNMALAISLARGLYQSTNAQWIAKTIAANSRAIKNANNHGTSPTGLVLDFDSTPAYILAIRYLLFRMLICGLLRTLTSLPSYRIIFPGLLSNEVEQNELSAATSATQCLDYALRPAPARPFVSLALMLPLEMSLAAWLRLRRRESGYPDSARYKHATKMIDWCIADLPSVSSRWRAGNFPRDDMESLYDVLMGGPLVAKDLRP